MSLISNTAELQDSTGVGAALLASQPILSSSPLSLLEHHAPYPTYHLPLGEIIVLREEQFQISPFTTGHQPVSKTEKFPKVSRNKEAPFPTFHYRMVFP